MKIKHSLWARETADVLLALLTITMLVNPNPVRAGDIDYRFETLQ
jgi:hypothetical protein